MEGRANQTRNKENQARNKKKSISKSSNENVLLLRADFRSLFRQFCATILRLFCFFIFFLAIIYKKKRKLSLYIFALFFDIILIFFLMFLLSG